MDDLFLLIVLAFVLGFMIMLHGIKSGDYFNFCVGLMAIAVGFICTFIKFFPI